MPSLNSNIFFLLMKIIWKSIERRCSGMIGDDEEDDETFRKRISKSTVIRLPFWNIGLREMMIIYSYCIHSSNYMSALNNILLPIFADLIIVQINHF